MHFKLVLFMAAALAAGLAIGCRTSTRSNLPDHITTVEVNMFHNKTMYKNLEGPLTRAIIDRVNQDARIRAVSKGGTAVITGEITSVTRTPVRQTINDRAATAQITIKAKYSFYDEVERRYIIRDASISSAETSAASGIYEVDKGEVASTAELGALNALAAEIVRRTLGMW